MVTWRVGGQEARALRRPDGRWVVKLPAELDSWPQLLAQRPSEVDRPIVHARSGSEAEPALRAAGFAPTTTDQVWRVPLANLPETPTTSATHRLVPVTECDLERVAALDTAVRRAIPSTAGWDGTVDDLRDELDDDEFDPSLYLIAEHRVTGSYDGLVRVWRRQPVPRLGCLGVTAPWRRTRLVLVLVGAMTRRLRARGVAEVVTETDLANRPPVLLARGHGARPVEQVVQWCLPRAQSTERAPGEPGRVGGSHSSKTPAGRALTMDP